MFKTINTIATLILTVAGVFLLPAQVSDALGLSWIGRVVGIGVALVLSVAALYHFFPPTILRAIGIKSSGPGPIMAKDEVSVSLNDDCSGRWIIKKLFIFRDKPSPAELVDVFLAPSGDLVDEGSYRSVDSRIVKVFKKAPNIVAITWSPTSQITCFAPYEHTYSYDLPRIGNERMFGLAFYCHLDTGIVSYSVRTQKPIARAIAGVLPRFRHRVTFQVLEQLPSKANWRICEQPTIESEGHVLRWVLHSPPRNRTIICYARFEETR
jgi:hypothetical protein